MTLSRLKELSNNRLTDAQLLAIKEEVKAECVEAVERKQSSYRSYESHLRLCGETPSKSFTMKMQGNNAKVLEEAIQAIKEV